MLPRELLIPEKHKVTGMFWKNLVAMFKGGKKTNPITTQVVGVGVELLGQKEEGMNSGRLLAVHRLLTGEVMGCFWGHPGLKESKTEVTPPPHWLLLLILSAPPAVPPRAALGGRDLGAFLFLRNRCGFQPY